MRKGLKWLAIILMTLYVIHLPIKFSREIYIVGFIVKSNLRFSYNEVKEAVAVSEANMYVLKLEEMMSGLSDDADDVRNFNIREAEELIAKHRDDDSEGVAENYQDDCEHSLHEICTRPDAPIDDTELDSDEYDFLDDH